MNSKRLATVLRVREMHERIARAEVGRRQAARTAAISAERAAWDILSTAPKPTSGSGTMFASRRQSFEAGIAEAQAHRTSVAEAETRVDESIAEWQIEAQKLDGIERLAERTRDEERAAAERAELVEIDDLVVSRWGRGVA